MSVSVQLQEGLPGLLKAVQAKDADIVSIRLANTLDNLAQLAVLQVSGCCVRLWQRCCCAVAMAEATNAAGEPPKYVRVWQQEAGHSDNAARTAVL